jgi:hypothetical protein
MVANCTFYNNFAQSGGGAISNSQDKTTLSLTNCTFSGNNSSAANLASGLDTGTNSAVALLTNNIFKHGTGVNIIDHTQNLTSNGHNISDDAAGGPAGTAPGGSLNGAQDLRNTDPQLATSSPENNGGPTLTFALNSTSPAIDRGEPAAAPPRDQRGYLRHGPPDIGAFEDMGELLGLVGATRTGTNLHDITVTCQVVDGFTYRLQRKANATDPTWQDIPGLPDLVATGDDTETLTDPNAITLGRAFYHVTLIP